MSVGVSRLHFGNHDNNDYNLSTSLNSNWIQCDWLIQTDSWGKLVQYRISYQSCSAYFFGQMLRNLQQKVTKVSSYLRFILIWICFFAGDGGVRFQNHDYSGWLRSRNRNTLKKGLISNWTAHQQNHILLSRLPTN